MSAPECIYKVDTDPHTGRVVKVWACPECEHDFNQNRHLRHYCRAIRGKLIHFKSCERHAQISSPTGLKTR